MSITIENAFTRRVIVFALWRVIAVDVVGERELSESFYDRAWREIEPAYAVDGAPGEAEFRMLRITVLGAAARTVTAARDGDRLSLPVAPDELARALHDCIRAIDQNDELFENLDAVDREDVLACRSAAVRQLGALRRQPQATLPPLPTQLVVPAFTGPMTVEVGVGVG